MDELYGADVITSLAKIYQQLYIVPGNDGIERYEDVVKKGQEIPNGDLPHFVTDQRDSLVYEDTPAGKVCVITLYNRQDFVTFLRIMANRCSVVDIPDTQGASILSGVINWTKIRAHKEEFYSDENSKGNLFPDWKTEFARFTSDKSNYLDTLIVLSVGPYSGICTDRMNGYLTRTGSGSKTLSNDEWLSLSDTIRKNHECTHFICQVKYPEKKDAIWDELVADAVGIYAAFGRFDRGMETLFLGIGEDGYTKGRLENYVEADSLEEKQEKLGVLSAGIMRVLKQFERMAEEKRIVNPYDLAVMFEENKDNIMKVG